MVYADVQGMHLHGICRCQEYVYGKPMLASLFFREDPKKASSGSSSLPPARSSAETQLAPLRQLHFSIYSVYPLPRDHPLTTVNGRCGYSLTVVHFRKLRNNVEIGSDRNGHPVIYRCCYMDAYYRFSDI